MQVVVLGRTPSLEQLKAFHEASDLPPLVVLCDVVQQIRFLSTATDDLHVRVGLS